MEFHEKLRILAGILCLFVAIMRIVHFFVDINGAIVYSAIFVDWDKAVNLIEGILTLVFAFFFTVVATGFAVLVYLGLGATVIAGRRLSAVIIWCNIITAISIILCIRALAIYASINEINIFLTFFLIIYIIIFSICLVSYLTIRKEK